MKVSTFINTLTDKQMDRNLQIWMSFKHIRIFLFSFILMEKCFKISLTFKLNTGFIIHKHTER